MYGLLSLYSTNRNMPITYIRKQYYIKMVSLTDHGWIISPNCMSSFTLTVKLFIRKSCTSSFIQLTILFSIQLLRKSGHLMFDIQCLYLDSVAIMQYSIFSNMDTWPVNLSIVSSLTSAVTHMYWTLTLSLWLIIMKCNLEYCCY